MFGFLVELWKMMKEIMDKVREPKLEEEKAKGIICKCVMVISEIKKYLIQLPKYREGML